MADFGGSKLVQVQSIGSSKHIKNIDVKLPDYDRQRIEDIGWLTAMTIVLLGNYAQTGHFGGPLAYTPYVVTSHLIGPELGGLRYDYRRPKHPYSDKFMLAGGHNSHVLRAVDGAWARRWRGARGDRRRSVRGRSERRDAVRRRARLPAQRRRDEGSSLERTS
jgi:hypothetical protein